MGFAIKIFLAHHPEQELTPVSDGIITLRILLQRNKKHLTLIRVYAPTMTKPVKIREEFHNSVRENIRAVPNSDKLIITGDFNARVG